MPQFDGTPQSSSIGSPNQILNVGPVEIEDGSAPSVIQGTVSVDGQSAVSSQDPNRTLTTDFVVKNRYESDKHIYMMGITTPTNYLNQSASFVQLAKPTLLWIADWTTCRVGSVPDIPEPIPPIGSNWVLMDEHYEPGSLDVGPDGVSAVYRISGTYVYGAKNPSNRIINQLKFSRPSWLKDYFRRTVSESDMKRGLIG